jgi:hypothetical protein
MEDKNTSSLFDVTGEEQKESKRKDFLNIISTTDLKRRQQDFHDELRKERR